MTDLKGLRVLNTRPILQAQELNQAIKAAGGKAIECPALSIRPKDQSCLAALPNLDKINQAIFISVNAVHCCCKLFIQEQIHWPAKIEVIALGDATASALKSYGIAVSVFPAIADSEHLLDLKNLQAVQKNHILIVKGEEGRTLIAETLKARGAHVHILEVYQRELPNFDRQQLDSLWQNESVDIILITSLQALQNLFTLFDKKAHAWLRRTPCLVISERLANEATLLGIQTIFVCSPKTILIRLHQFNQGLIHE